MDPLQGLLQYLNGPQSTDAGVYEHMPERFVATSESFSPRGFVEPSEDGSFEEVDRLEEADLPKVHGDADGSCWYPFLTDSASRPSDETNQPGSLAKSLPRSRFDGNPSSQRVIQPRSPLIVVNQVQRGEVSSASSNVAGPVVAHAMQHHPAGPIVQGTQLVPVEALPDSMRSVFSFKLFNLVQSRCFEIVYDTDENLVLSAPTGSGKTAVFELAICRLKRTCQIGDFKVVYMSPTKALCSERRRDWESRFQHMGLRCSELTGDTSSVDASSVLRADVVVTTPEKWEATTRRWNDRANILRQVRLVLIDEVHMLKEDRGATLEAVIARMKSNGSEVRFIALSATIPNAEDIACWLGRANKSSLPAHCKMFGEDFRPVPLQKHVIGVDTPGGDYGMDQACDTRLPDILATYSAGKPTLIFCGTRQATFKTAEKLASSWKSQAPTRRPWTASASSLKTNDSDLAAMIACGVAYHHAGVQPSDRAMVEDEFRRGALPIVCCTTTLAVGVNLPCYLVVIKNTTSWQSGMLKEYSDLELMQMLGRAGRPQYDRSAVAVILTRKEKTARYKKLVSGEEVLESSLHQNLIEYLNAEISMGAVRDVESAQSWLSGTFLAVRLQRNPRHYKLSDTPDSESSEQMVSHICHRDISLLQEAQLLEETLKFRCTQLGHAMSRYCVKFETMQTFIEITEHARISDLLSALASAAEFRDVRWRSGEKQFYKALNAMPGIKFPIKVDLALAAHKRSLIIQAQLGRIDLPSELKSAKHRRQHDIDRRQIFAHINRLVRCIVDCQVYRQDAHGTRNALSLVRSLGAQCWDDSPLQLIQIPTIGPVAIRKLIGSHIDSIESLEATEPHRINTILSRAPGYGETLLNGLRVFPKLRICIKLLGLVSKAGKLPKVNLKVEIGFMNDKAPEYYNKKKVYCCFLAERTDGKLLEFQRFGPANLDKNVIRLSVEISDMSQRIICSTMCDEIAGTLRTAEFKPSLPADVQSSLKSLQEAGESDGQTRESEVVNTISSHFLERTAQKSLPLDPFETSLNDMDMLAAVDEAENQHSTKQGSKVGSVSSWPLEQRHVQSSNGKWICNHKCKDKTACKHLCCRDGLDKPTRSKKGSATEDGRFRQHVAIGAQKSTVTRSPLRCTDASQAGFFSGHDGDATGQDVFTSRPGCESLDRENEWLPYRFNNEENHRPKSCTLPTLQQLPDQAHGFEDLPTHFGSTHRISARQSSGFQAFSLAVQAGVASTTLGKDSEPRKQRATIIEIPVVDLSMIEPSESIDGEEVEQAHHSTRSYSGHDKRPNDMNNIDGYSALEIATEQGRSVHFRPESTTRKRPISHTTTETQQPRKKRA